MNILQRRSTHSARLERWLGAENVELMSRQMRGWYGPPIAVSGVPGSVWVGKDGDFVGIIRAGHLGSAIDQFAARFRRRLRRQFSQVNTGFASLSDLIAEASAGKQKDYNYFKTGATGVAGATNTLWFSGGQPTTGANAGAAPGGTPWTKTSTGALDQVNGSTFGGSDTLHFVLANILATAGNQLLFYDRLFSATKTMNSTTNEAVTGVPTRYQSTTASDPDHAGGNFLIIECRAALPATAHNWNAVYTDQAGNASAALPQVTGNSSCIASRLDQPAGTWFNPLASGDTGIQQLDEMDCSALVASGNIDFTIGHPLFWAPCQIANITCVADGLNTAFNLVRIFDDACLTALEICKPATTATTYLGTITLVAG